MKHQSLLFPCRSPSACYCYICKRRGLGVGGAKTFHFVTVGSPENQSRATQIKKPPIKGLTWKYFWSRGGWCTVKTCEPFYHVYSSPSLALDRQLTAVFISISYPFIAAWHIVTAGQIELVSLAMNNSTFLVVVSALFLSSLVASAQHQEHQ